MTSGTTTTSRVVCFDERDYCMRFIYTRPFSLATQPPMPTPRDSSRLNDGSRLNDSSRLTAANLNKLPKAERIEKLLKVAQMQVDADEDASHLLSQVQDEMDRSSRPGTGRSSQKQGGVYHVAPPSTAQSDRPPSTAGGMSIAGSLRGRIKESLLSRESEFRKGKDALKPSVHTGRPGTGMSSRPGTGMSSRPGTGMSQRPPSTAASQRPPTGDEPRVLTLVEKPPIIDYTDIMPDHMVEKFREEFRAMKLAEEAAAEAYRPPTGASSRPSTGRPLAEVSNIIDVSERLPTPALSQASSRPLTGHAEKAMMPKAPPTAPEARPWSKKGRRGAPTNLRAASSEMSEALSWN